MWLHPVETRCAECQDLEENGALEPKMFPNFKFSRFSAPPCSMHDRTDYIWEDMVGGDCSSFTCEFVYSSVSREEL
jgi:hypothetical protein